MRTAKNLWPNQRAEALFWSLVHPERMVIENPPHTHTHTTGYKRTSWVLRGTKTL